MPANGQKAPTDGNQKQAAEHRDRHRFTQAAVGNQNSKGQPSQNADEPSGQENATGPAMKLNMPGSNPAGKLQRCDQEEEAAWKNVQQCQERVRGKPAIDPRQFCWPLPRERIVSMQSIHNPLPHRFSAREEIVSKDGAADGRSHADHDEQQGGSPQGSLGTHPNFHARAELTLIPGGQPPFPLTKCSPLGGLVLVRLKPDTTNRWS